MPSPDRRTFIKGLTSVLALGGVSSVQGHPGADEHPSFAAGHDIHRHNKTEAAELVGFHTLGGVGSESFSGGPDNPLYGMITETWLEGDLGFVAIQSSSEPTGNRGVAILDISPYTRAESRTELEDAEMSVLSYIGNETEAGTGNDVKVSKDGTYLAYSKQALGATYGEPASPSTEDQDAIGPSVTGAEVYDISDPGNPEYLGSAQGPNAGFHNCFVHQIGGDHYFFGVQGAVPGSAGVHIYRIDDDEGVIPVNYWGGNDLPLVSYGTESAGYGPGFYCHDFYAHDDPKTGRPLGFVAYWNNGGVVLDLSDPTDITALGRGEMPRTHYVQPAPDLIDGKRVFVGGQEHSSQDGKISGLVRAWDADNIFEDGFTTCEELDTWTLYDNVSYDGYDFSPHNNDITADGWITQSHYHAGVRFLKIQPPGEGDVNTDGWHIAGRRVESTNDEPITQETDENGEPVQEFETNDDGVFTSGFANARLVEEAQAYYSGHVEVPEESKTETVKSPDFWSARTLNGVTFGAGQHTGFYAIAADPMDVGTRTPADVRVTRTESSSVFTSGQVNELTYEVSTNREVRLRDRLPSNWSVLVGDSVTVDDTGDGKQMEFDEPVSDGDTRTVIVAVDSSPGSTQVGPIQYAAGDDPSMGGKDWEPIPDTVSAVLVGPEQP